MDKDPELFNISKHRRIPHIRLYKAYHTEDQPPTNMGSIEDFTSSTSGTTSYISTLSDVALKDPIFSDEVIQYHLSLLKPGNGGEVVSDESVYSPIISSSVLAYHAKLAKERDNPKIPQFGLLAGSSPLLQNIHPKKASLGSLDEDPRLLFNVSHPSSIFICGSQGSGKSHTLSCLLESCLISSKAGRLPNPLTGLVFHYDTFISDTMGSPCEAAFLSSHSDVQVRVLCSPTNLHSMRVSALRPHLIGKYHNRQGIGLLFEV